MSISAVNPFLRRFGDGDFYRMNELDVYNNEVYVVSNQAHTIRVYNLAGVLQRYWGGFGSSSGKFNDPWGIFVYNDEVYVVDQSNERVQVFTAAGVFVRKWSGGMDYPSGICVYNDEVYVSDYYDIIRVYNLTGTLQRTFGAYGTGDGQMKDPRGLFVYEDEVYVCDEDNHRIQVFNLAGTFQRKWGGLSNGSGDGEFHTPQDIFVRQGEVYVADYLNYRIQVFKLDGTFLRKWGSSGDGDNEFNNPCGVAVYDEEVFVANNAPVSASGRVQVFTAINNYIYPPVPVPDYPFRSRTYYDVLATNISGKELRRSRHTTARRSWTLTYHAIHNGDCNYLWNFYTARIGQRDKFYFYHPESDVEYLAKFAEGSLKRKEIGRNLFDITVELIEVLL